MVHQAFAHPVPDSMSDDEAALLEPLSVGLGLHEGRVSPGSRVLVTGAGPIGLVASRPRWPSGPPRSWSPTSTRPAELAR